MANACRTMNPRARRAVRIAHVAGGGHGIMIGMDASFLGIAELAAAPSVAVVVDVMRAFTVAAWAFARGAATWPKQPAQKRCKLPERPA